MCDNVEKPTPESKIKMRKRKHKKVRGKNGISDISINSVLKKLG